MTSARPSIDDPDECPNRAAHTYAPRAYTAWHHWASRMNRTHRQIRCEGCGRFRIWIPRTPRPAGDS